MGWNSKPKAPATPASEKMLVENSVNDFFDFKEGYLPLLPEYLDRTKATPQALTEARGSANADVQASAKGADTTAVGNATRQGIGASPRTASAISGINNEVASAASTAKNNADFSRHRLELAGKMKMAAIGRDLSNTQKVAQANQATGQTQQSINTMNNRVAESNYLAEGIGTGVGMYSASNGLFKKDTK